MYSLFLLFVALIILPPTLSGQESTLNKAANRSDGVVSDADALQTVENALNALGGRAQISSYGALRIDVTSKIEHASEQHSTWSSDWASAPFRHADVSRDQLTAASAPEGTAARVDTPRARQLKGTNPAPDPLKTLSRESPAHAIWFALDRQNCRVRSAKGNIRNLPQIFDSATQHMVWFNCPYDDKPAEVWLWAFSKQTMLPIAVWIPSSGFIGAPMAEIVQYGSFTKVAGLAMPVDLTLDSRQAPRQTLYFEHHQLMAQLPTDTSLSR